jgi:hypothetical protein
MREMIIMIRMRILRNARILRRSSHLASGKDAVDDQGTCHDSTWFTYLQGNTKWDRKGDILVTLGREIRE